MTSDNDPKDWRTQPTTDGDIIATGIIGVLVLVLVGFLIFSNGYETNVYTEVLSLIVTIAVIDRLNKRRIEKERTEELILQMGSPNNALAVEAARILEKRGHLKDGSLRKKHFIYADLRSVKWHNADLIECAFTLANFRGAFIMNSNLREAVFMGANLERAVLSESNFRYVKFEGANLRESSLSEIDLSGANLNGANLRRARLDNIQFSEETTLP